MAYVELTHAEWEDDMLQYILSTWAVISKHLCDAVQVLSKSKYLLTHTLHSGLCMLAGISQVSQSNILYECWVLQQDSITHITVFIWTEMLNS